MYHPVASISALIYGVFPHTCMAEVRHSVIFIDF